MSKGNLRGFMSTKKGKWWRGNVSVTRNRVVSHGPAESYTARKFDRSYNPNVSFFGIPIVDDHVVFMCSNFETTNAARVAAFDQAEAWLGIKTASPSDVETAHGDARQALEAADRLVAEATAKRNRCSEILRAFHLRKKAAELISQAVEIESEGPC